MSSQDDTPGTPEQKAFGKWVSDMLAYLEHERGMSLREVARVSGISHTQIYRWMGKPKSKGYSRAQSEKVQQFCRRLKLPYEEAATALGWTRKPKAGQHADLDGFIRRAKMEAAHPKTTGARRKELQELIDDAEATQRMLRRAEELLREALNEDQPES